MAEAQYSSIFADRRRLIGRVLKVTIVTLALFVWPNWVSGAHAFTIVELLLVPVLCVMLWLLRAGTPVVALERALMVCALVLFSSLLVFPTIENTGPYWVAAFPFVAYFIRPVHSAIRWVAVMVLVVILAGVLEGAGWIDMTHTAVQVFCLLAVVVFFWFFAHTYQSQLEYRQELLESSNRELDEQKSRLQTVLDNVPLAIWMMDAERKVQFVNKAKLAWSGIGEEEAKHSRYISDLLSPELRDRSEQTDLQCLEGESGTIYDRAVSHAADGSERILDIIKVRRTAADGKTLGLLGFAIDVTEQVRADEVQKQLERQMEHAQRLESLGIMAGGIAHDFNNLLTAIQGNVELASMESDLPGPVRESLAGIASASRTATDLCRQMLAYSGKGILRPEVFSLQSVVEDMRPLLETSAGKSVRLELDLSDASLIHGDRGQIRQVLLNMVMNAAEAMVAERQGQIRISLRQIQLSRSSQNPLTGVGMSPGCYTELAVADNGTGMDEEVKQRMFEPFYTTKFTGRGLGMSAVLGILKAHDAGLEVESVEGVGTTMRVLFPCVQAAAEQEKPGEVVQPTQPGGQVLVVDDEPQVLKTASRMLERLGCEVVMADSGEVAIQRFSENPSGFGWVLLDVTMPGMDGVECMRRLREIRPDIRVVMSSGYNAEALESSAAVRPDDFLGKPYTFKTLQELASRVGAMNKSG